MEYQHGGDIYSQEVELDYSANLNPLGLPEGVRRTLHQCLDTQICSLYPDSRCDSLRTALGEHHHVAKQWVVCGNGAADLIFGLVNAKRPRRGLVTAPTFSEYEQALKVCGCRTDYLYLEEAQGFSLDTKQLIERILEADKEGCPYDMVFLCNPNNPTGIPVLREEVLDAAAACAETGALLVTDECFGGFLDQPSRFSVIGELEHHKNLFVLKAFTKLYAMAGLRLGYGLCSDLTLMEGLCMARQPWSVSGLAEKAGTAALKEGDYTERTRKLIGQEREWLRRELWGLGFWVYDSQANYLFFKTDLKTPEGWLYSGLLKRRILIRSCKNYPGLDSSFYRICVKTREENERLMEQMKAVKEEYRKLQLRKEET